MVLQLGVLPFSARMQRYTSQPGTLEIAESFAEGVPSLDRRKVLLLEDDDDFKGIMREFLHQNGFEVVAVQNGVEGVHEVLASDFEVILCDMMMPTLPGDMFFRAVERMRPHLCDRFIFMTGHRGNVKVNEFIKAVNGTILSKPFQIDDLLEMIAFVQVRMAMG
jgi:DNA-binding response OmpR family regulator